MVPFQVMTLPFPARRLFVQKTSMVDLFHMTLNSGQIREFVKSMQLKTIHYSIAIKNTLNFLKVRLNDGEKGLIVLEHVGAITRRTRARVRFTTVHGEKLGFWADDEKPNVIYFYCMCPRRGLSSLHKHFMSMLKINEISCLDIHLEMRRPNDYFEVFELPRQVSFLRIGGEDVDWWKIRFMNDMFDRINIYYIEHPIEGLPDDISMLNTETLLLRSSAESTNLEKVLRSSMARVYLGIQVTVEQFMSFVKEWKMSSNSTLLVVLCMELSVEDVPTQEEIIAELGASRWNSARRARIAVVEENVFDLKDGLDLERADGTLATVQIESDRFSLIVWDNRFPTENDSSSVVSQ